MQSFAWKDTIFSCKNSNIYCEIIIIIVISQCGILTWNGTEIKLFNDIKTYTLGYNSVFFLELSLCCCLILSVGGRSNYFLAFSSLLLPSLSKFWSHHTSCQEQSLKLNGVLVWLVDSPVQRCNTVFSLSYQFIKKYIPHKVGIHHKKWHINSHCSWRHLKWCRQLPV